MFNGKEMNPIRKRFIRGIQKALIAHNTRDNLADRSNLDLAYDLNQEFIDRSRGKGRSKR